MCSVHDDALTTAAPTDFWSDVPAPTGATQKSEDAAGDGSHRYYTTTASAVDAVTGYEAQATGAGWAVTDSGGGGFGPFGGGGFTATKSSEVD
jgi:hypothetical protein